MNNILIAPPDELKLNVNCKETIAKIVSSIHPDSKVLEIGAGVGLCTVAIAMQLCDSAHLVAVDPDPANFYKLYINRELNQSEFRIMEGALSKYPLLLRETETFMTHDRGDVAVFDYAFLTDKSNFKFDTIVVHYSRKFLFTMIDFPEILKDAQTIIMKSDFMFEDHERQIHSKLAEAGFTETPDYMSKYELWIKPKPEN